MRRIKGWIVCALMVAAVAACRGPGGEGAAARSGADDATQPSAAVAARVSDAAIGRPVDAAGPPNNLYPADGVQSLVDGRLGSDEYYDPEWMGWWYEDKPFEVTIDLGQLVAVEELGVHVLSSAESWIFYPRSVEFELSKDGETYKTVGTVMPTDEELSDEYPATTILKATDLREEARFVRVRAERYGPLPQWHLGHGGADGYKGEAWLFIDEILVNPVSR